MAKQEASLKTLYFYFLRKDNDFRMEEAQVTETPKMYKFLPGSKRIDGYYNLTVKKEDIGKLQGGYYYSLVILDEDNPNKAINLFIEGKKNVIATNERSIVEAKNRISKFNNDIECLKQMILINDRDKEMQAEESEMEK